VICIGGTVTNIAYASGGTGLYDFDWNNGAVIGSSMSDNPLAAATYTVLVPDANGRTSPLIPINVTLPPPLLLTVSPYDSICVGGSADISANALGGDGGPYTCNWSDGAGFTFTGSATTLSPTQTTMYCVTVMDGCSTPSVLDSVEIFAHPTPIITIDADVYSGCALLVVTFMNTTDPNQVNGDCLCDFGNGTTSTDCASPQAIYDTEGSYDVTLTLTSPATITVTINPPLTLTASAYDSISVGGSAEVNANASVGDGGPCAYNWSDGVGFTFTGPGTAVSPTQTTMYYVTVTDGCSTPAVVESVLIFIHPTPIVALEANTYSGCAPLSVTFLNTTDPNLVGTNCFWDFGNRITASYCQNVQVIYDDAGTYDVTLTVTSPAGCAGTTTVNQMITVYPIPTADSELSPDPANILDPTVHFTNLSVGANTYFWNFADLGNSIEEHPSFEFPAPGFYEVTLDITSIYGCVAEHIDTVEIQDLFPLYVPNAFTPDGDGLNDGFFPTIMGMSAADYEFLIFDRWGALIFSSDNLGEAWDGTYRGVVAQQDVYVWKLIVTDARTSDSKGYVGQVTLLR
jgi:gliding motility-associated-like protein